MKITLSQDAMIFIFTARPEITRAVNILLLLWQHRTRENCKIRTTEELCLYTHIIREFSVFACDVLNEYFSGCFSREVSV